MFLAEAGEPYAEDHCVVCGALMQVAGGARGEVAVWRNLGRGFAG